MTTKVFKSSIANRLADFCDYKQLQNYDYRKQIENLRVFDRFLVRKNYDDVFLTQTIVEQYMSFLENYSPMSRYNRLSIVSAFSRYFQLYKPESYVLHKIPLKKPKCRRFYIFSDEDIKALLKNCSPLKPKKTIVPHTYRTLFGLLYCTGIRINEALSLTLGNLYLEKSLFFVRKGKFGKDRWISLSASSVRAIDHYVTIRQHSCPGTQDDPLFINRFEKKLGYEQVRRTFRKLIDTCQIVNKHSEKNIRLHDLRHTYATKCLLTWYQSGEDINTKLPFLATAMGHVKISSTQIYIHITDQIRSHAHQRFSHKFQQNIFKEGVSK